MRMRGSGLTDTPPRYFLSDLGSQLACTQSVRKMAAGRAGLVGLIT
jgi:hypothetical protein